MVILEKSCYLFEIVSTKYSHRILYLFLCDPVLLFVPNLNRQKFVVLTPMKVTCNLHLPWIPFGNLKISEKKRERIATLPEE